jgi:hypothetical protein
MQLHHPKSTRRPPALLLIDRFPGRCGSIRGLCIPYAMYGIPLEWSPRHDGDVLARYAGDVQLHHLKSTRRPPALLLIDTFPGRRGCIRGLCIPYAMCGIPLEWSPRHDGDVLARYAGDMQLHYPKSTRRPRALLLIDTFPGRRGCIRGLCIPYAMYGIPLEWSPRHDCDVLARYAGDIQLHHPKSTRRPRALLLIDTFPGRRGCIRGLCIPYAMCGIPLERSPMHDGDV